MKNLIIQASEILEDKFKIKPERTELYLHKDIQKFLKKTKNPQAKSIFFPRDLSAHVPENRLDLAIHEFHGHGLYCEQTQYGQKMVSDEQNFESMSQEEIQKALELHEYMRLNFEAHALWTEDFLLREIKEEELLEKRLKELETLQFNDNFNQSIKNYKDVYNKAKQFEKDNGVYELWYTFDFPKQFDNQILIEITKEKLNSRFKNLVFLILFGSQKKTSDIDLCAVLEDNCKTDEYYESNIIDLSQFNYSEFLRKLRLFDIPTIEPLITGKLIIGDKKEFENLKKQALNTVPDEKAINYLRNQAFNCFSKAICLFEEYKKLKEKGIYTNGVTVSLNNLSYSLGYFITSEKYKNGSFLFTLKENNNPLLERIRKTMKESYYKNIEDNTFYEYIRDVKNFLEKI
ncbi:MAG: nucleotidyltransferase domain-containing protein [Nanoarchaeota archaeon]